MVTESTRIALVAGHLSWLCAFGLCWLALPLQAAVTQVIECRKDFLVGDFPFSLQDDFRIRIVHEPEDPFYRLESELWRVADFNVRQAELELSFEGIGPVVEPGSGAALRQIDGQQDFDDEFTLTAESSGQLNVEDHVVVSFEVDFESTDPGMIADHLGDPTLAQLGLADRATCRVFIRLLDRPLNFPLTRLFGTVGSITLEPGPGQPTDVDADQVDSNVDNCPEHFNPGQENADRDRVGDACDLSFSRDVYVTEVAAGDASGFRAAVDAAGQRPLNTISEIRLAGDINLLPPPQIGTPPPGVVDPDSVLIINRDIRILGRRPDGRAAVLSNAGNVDGLRFARVTADGALTLARVEITGMDTDGDGAVVLVDPGGDLRISESRFDNNRTEADGGVVHFSGDGALTVSGSRFEGNAADRGGALFIDAPDARVGEVRISHSQFEGNTANAGCDLHAKVSDEGAEWHALIANQTCAGGSVLAGGRLRASASTLHADDGEIVVADAEWQLLTSALSGGRCTGAGLASQGYNFAADDSCVLAEATDLSGIDPQLSGPDAAGLRRPHPDSPLVDAGPAGLVSLPGSPWASLPCGWKDAAGLGRPQDGDGDGQFECDIGAVEHPGEGAIGPGHSGAYYNPQRSGEGQYVEILDDQRALIYTFTYRPGGGPAWFLAAADIVGNSLVSSALIRPTGTVFGAGFKAAQIWRAEWGGMSMVFPDCAATATPGNVVYSGNPAQDFEPLVTRAQRLTHITGCGAGTPSPNTMANFSGSFYDPQRSGEGLVVEWLPNGDVLAIMFTFDLEGEQLWLFGIGTPIGDSVTIDAVYPSGDAAWGGDFDPAAVGLAPWGTLTLDYTDCNGITFSYAALSLSFGSATRNYQRLSNLAGANCPQP